MDALGKLYDCKLNTVAWVVELTYLRVVVECESLLDGHGKACCTVIIILIFALMMMMIFLIMIMIYSRQE